MTSFAFIAGLIPLIVASGAGAIGNRTIGGSALGGMLIGTIFGVIAIPGLYYVFAKLAEGRSLIKDESFEPISEEFMRASEGESKTKQAIKELKSMIKKLTKRENND
jgi:HAE1 family hydrophobic/amphiphilic exporter-1